MEGLIYGVRLRSEFAYYYVGLTTKSIKTRLKQHFKVARSGRKTPFYDWLRAHDYGDVVADELHRVEGLEELGRAEIAWIELLRRAGRPYGRNHSAEQRAQWSKLRKGTNSGPDNPNYGKFGEDHPSFGRVMSEQAREKLAEKRRGRGNPNYGRRASEETRAKMSAVRKGRPMPSSRRSAHRGTAQMGASSEKRVGTALKTRPESVTRYWTLLELRAGRG
jgi:hypothetical protein